MAQHIEALDSRLKRLDQPASDSLDATILDTLLSGLQSLGNTIDEVLEHRDMSDARTVAQKLLVGKPRDNTIAHLFTDAGERIDLSIKSHPVVLAGYDTKRGEFALIPARIAHNIIPSDFAHRPINQRFVRDDTRFTYDESDQRGHSRLRNIRKRRTTQTIHR